MAASFCGPAGICSKRVKFSPLLSEYITSAMPLFTIRAVQSGNSKRALQSKLVSISDEELVGTAVSSFMQELPGMRVVDALCCTDIARLDRADGVEVGLSVLQSSRASEIRRFGEFLLLRCVSDAPPPAAQPMPSALQQLMNASRKRGEAEKEARRPEMLPPLKADTR